MKPTTSSLTVEISQLRIGMFVQLDLGWLAHPFPTSSFKISTPKQIETIRALGLKHVTYVPAKSDVLTESKVRDALTQAAEVASAASPSVAPVVLSAEQQRQQRLAREKKGLEIANARFGETAQQFREMMDDVAVRPAHVREQCQAMVGQLVAEMSNGGDSAIRLLSENLGDRSAQHAINSMVLSLLLGRAMGLTPVQLMDLGMGAFLHDMGKLELPQRARFLDADFTPADHKLYQDHVNRGVVMAKRMGLSEGVMAVIAQHHEMVDGSGFPMQLAAPRLTLPAKILALVNRYENLCNPLQLATALTPHEALSLLFAQQKTRFDTVVLSAFIRMMGVYPPGSIIQLVDDRYAMVVSVNSSRPLKPRVIVHSQDVAPDAALILDLEKNPELSIRRSIRPANLPPEANWYLSPRKRMAYFFEREHAVDFSNSGLPA